MKPPRRLLIVDGYNVLNARDHMGTLADARALLRAGATRLGTSAGVALVEALRTQEIAPAPIPRKVQDSQLIGEGCDNVQT